MDYAGSNADRTWLLEINVRGQVPYGYLVAEEQLGDVIDQVAGDPTVRDLQCKPFRAIDHRVAWVAFTAGPPQGHDDEADRPRDRAEPGLLLVTLDQ